jgi:uncharacterized membrane protein YhaH (DUF805 family)
MATRPRFGFVTHLAFAIDLVTIAGIVHLFSRSAFYGWSALVLFAVAPLLPLIGRRRTVRSASSGIPMPFLSEGRGFIRLEPLQRAWVVEPFYASLNIAFCVLAFLLPYGLLCKERATDSDAAGLIAFLGLMGPVFIGAIGLAATRLRLMAAIPKDDAV